VRGHSGCRMRGNVAVLLVINNSNLAENAPLDFVWRMREGYCKRSIACKSQLCFVEVTW
jgi:hypothetical protein